MEPQDTSVQFLFVLTNQDANSWWILVDPDGFLGTLMCPVVPPGSTGSISTVPLHAGNQDADHWWILMDPADQPV